jgi:hypothetical protein
MMVAADDGRREVAVDMTVAGAAARSRSGGRGAPAVEGGTIAATEVAAMIAVGTIRANKPPRQSESRSSDGIFAPRWHIKLILGLIPAHCYAFKPTH